MCRKTYVVPITEVMGVAVDNSVLQGSAFGEDYGDWENGARRRTDSPRDEKVTQGIEREKDSWRYMRVNSLW